MPLVPGFLCIVGLNKALVDLALCVIKAHSTFQLKAVLSSGVAASVSGAYAPLSQCLGILRSGEF